MGRTRDEHFAQLSREITAALAAIWERPRWYGRKLLLCLAAGIIGAVACCILFLACQKWHPRGSVSFAVGIVPASLSVFGYLLWRHRAEGRCRPRTPLGKRRGVVGRFFRWCGAAVVFLTPAIVVCLTLGVEHSCIVLGWLRPSQQGEALWLAVIGWCAIASMPVTAFLYERVSGEPLPIPGASRGEHHQRGK